MPVTTQLANKDDAGVLAELAAATFPLAVLPGTPKKDVDAFIDDVLSPTAFEQYLSDPNRFLVLARINGLPVAYAMVNMHETTDDDVLASVHYRPTCELSKTYVLPGYQGHGIARELMATTLQEAAIRGARGVWVGVNQRNVKALEFYTRAGFVTVGDKTFLIGMSLHMDNILERKLP